MKKTKLKKLKPHFEKIIILLYKYRFLNREQIQTLLNHKYHNRINLWLNYLTQEKYITRYYTKKFAEEPAAYSLGLKSKQYLNEHKEIKDIKERLLKRVYREKKYSVKFKKHCMFLADIYFALNVFTKTNKTKLNFYAQTDLKGMKYLIYKEPDAYFSIENSQGIAKRYFLDIFDRFSQWKDLDKRIDEYIGYFENNLWQNNTNKPFPEIILVCPDENTKKHMKRIIKKKLDQQFVDMLFYLSSWEEIKQNGISRQVLHKVD